jgi:hypothetical protein
MCGDWRRTIFTASPATCHFDSQSKRSQGSLKDALFPRPSVQACSPPPTASSKPSYKKGIWSCRTSASSRDDSRVDSLNSFSMATRRNSLRQQWAISSTRTARARPSDVLGEEFKQAVEAVAAER